MTELLSVEDILTAATEIYNEQEDEKQEAMRALIEVYYIKVQNILSNKVIFSESEALCPHCTGVRLMKREVDISTDSSSLNRDYKCPICKSWYAAAEVTGSADPIPSDPILTWDKTHAPAALAALIPDGGWITLVSQDYAGYSTFSFPNTNQYGVLPDGRVGKTLEDKTFQIVPDIHVPDLAGYKLFIN